ncbi:mucin-3A-like [Tachysurus fulvidraco]|uniref:mucin-3A-like n=1 Tax=Tachysurus fulvidraco TaxID=1234273 RepID=UPI001FEECBB9|nr:mucin-3A-like [Tachysurus fulvidraco]
MFNVLQSVKSSEVSCDYSLSSDSTARSLMSDKHNLIPFSPTLTQTSTTETSTSLFPSPKQTSTTETSAGSFPTITQTSTTETFTTDSPVSTTDLITTKYITTRSFPTITQTSTTETFTTASPASTTDLITTKYITTQTSTAILYTHLIRAMTGSPENPQVSSLWTIGAVCLLVSGALLTGFSIFIFLRTDRRGRFKDPVEVYTHVIYTLSSQQLSEETRLLSASSE